MAGRRRRLKAGVIRCQQTEDICPGTTDFKVLPLGKLAAAEVGPVEIVGFVSCGGCPGKRAVARVRTLLARGAEVIFLASCIRKGNPIGFPCPHVAMMKAAIEEEIEGRARLIDWTH